MVTLVCIFRKNRIGMICGALVVVFRHLVTGRIDLALPQFPAGAEFNPRVYMCARARVG